MLRICLLSCSLCLLWFNLLCRLAVARAASSPRGAQRGTDAVLLFNGARLADAQEIALLLRPASASPSSKPSTTTRSRPPSRSPPTAGSASTPCASAPPPASRSCAPSGSAPCPVVDEKEPNSDFTAPQKIPLNVTVHGVVENEDVDYFAVECKKGQRLSRRDRGHAPGEHALRPLHRHPGLASALSWRPPTTLRCSARTPPARSSSRPTAPTSFRCARAPTAATAAVSIGCTSAPSRGRWRSFPPAASSARRSK